MRFSDSLLAWARRLKHDGLTLWFAVRCPTTPWLPKGIGLVVVAYALSPIDLIPDFIPVLGYLDDVLLLPGLIWLAVKLLPANVLRDCRANAEAWVAARRPRPRIMAGAVMIIVLWAVAILGGVGAWLAKTDV